MSEEAAKNGWWTPIRVGLALSLLVTAGFVAMAIQRKCILLDSAVLECRINWNRFLDSKPNEIGDTLAGFAGTLAFIWIVVTVWLQSKELADQRRVLIEQKNEFKHMVEAQRAQVRALEAQAAILVAEKASKDQASSFSKVTALADEIQRICRLEKLTSAYWRFERDDGTGGKSSKTYSLLQSPRDHLAKVLIADQAESLAAALSGVQETAIGAIAGGWKVAMAPDLSNELRRISRAIEGINEMYDSVSPADQVRILSFALESLSEAIQDAEDHPNYWRIWARSKKT